ADNHQKAVQQGAAKQRRLVLKWITYRSDKITHAKAGALELCTSRIRFCLRVGLAEISTDRTNGNAATPYKSRALSAQWHRTHATHVLRLHTRVVVTEISSG